MADRIDPYAVLQVVPTAHQEVLQAAYRALARLYHPDHNPEPDAARRMVELNKAWRVVGTPAKRAAYDATASIYVPRSPAADPDARSAESAAGAGVDDRPQRRPRSAGSNGRPTTSSGREPEREASEPVRPKESTSTSSSGTRWYSPAFADGPVAPPPGRPSGSVLDFGRYQGWSLGEIARVDRNYLEWFKRMPIGRRFQSEIEDLLDGPVEMAAGAPRPILARRGFLGRRR